MASRQWRDQVIQELHRQGLPSAYVDRLVDELSDHATDLFMEDRDMDVQHGDAISSIEARMGSPKQLASVAKAEFRRRTFAGRYPAVTFIAGPIAAVIGTVAAIFLLLFALGWLTGLIDDATGGHLAKIDRTSPSAVGYVHDHEFDLPIRAVCNTSLVLRAFRPPQRASWVEHRSVQRPSSACPFLHFQHPSP